MPVAANNDAELVAGTLTGDRDAFSQIVSRYQSLICSLTYSATGNLGQSEDLAQETFISAWKHLGQLRERDKLRSWLCGIARNRINNFLRREGREPLHQAGELDEISETHSPEPLPVDYTISNEEQAILWRSLERIPEIYREPLVLFYREHQSIETVAEKLELTEDTVKQRLSRGRKMLHEQVLAFVEGALERTNPGKVFTLGVLAALPLLATSAKAAAIGATAAKGSATAKAAATVGLFGAFFAPVIGILAGVLGTKIGIDRAQSPRDRRFRVKMAWINWSLVLAFYVLLTGGIFLGRPYWTTHPVLLTWAIISVAFGYGVLIVWLAFWTSGRQRRIGLEEAAGLSCGAVSNGPRSIEYRSPWTLLGWPLIHIHFGGAASQRLPAKGWIACGNVAYGILFASGGMAVGAVSMGGIAVGGVAIGGCSVGLLTFGGMAFGVFATGGLAVGYMACGGASIAWLAACGGAAVAHNFALGGAALAQHANDPAARTFARNSVLLSHAFLFVNLSILLSCLSMVPEVLYRRKQSRQQPAGR
jgi:RNA polymerase sigma factor (sigma-70 family)